MRDIPDLAFPDKKNRCEIGLDQNLDNPEKTIRLTGDFVVLKSYYLPRQLRLPLWGIDFSLRFATRGCAQFLLLFFTFDIWHVCGLHPRKYGYYSTDMDCAPNVNK